MTIKQAKVTGIEFEGATKPEITGTTYTLEAAGVPTWVNVTYSVEGQDGTSFSAAGTYKFTATFTHSNNNYEQITPMTATLIISDKPKVEGADDIVVEKTIDVVYSGSPVDYKAKNVPEGVKDTYVILKDGTPFEGTEIVDAGVYTITVSFETAPDKAPIGDGTCVVTVSKANYVLDEEIFKSATLPFDGEEHTLEIVGELPEWITNVVYTVEGQDGTSFSEVGTYKFTVTFTHTNGNYNELKPMTATLTITTAAVSLNVSFEDLTVTYNGGEHTLEITGDLPSWVSVSYYIGEEVFTGKIEAGT